VQPLRRSPLLALARAEGVTPSGLELHDIDTVAIARNISEQQAPPALRACIDMHFVADVPSTLFVPIHVPRHGRPKLEQVASRTA